MTDKIDTSQANNRWPSILPSLGISRDFLTGKHGPCPLCGEGKDRWRFDDKDGRGTWFCSKCGAGDGVKLIMIKHRVGFMDAWRMIKPVAGLASEIIAKSSRTDAEKRAAILDVARSSLPISPQNAAGKYLARRLIFSEIGGLRHHAPMPYFSPPEPPKKFPALLAAVRDECGRLVQIHRTFLTDDGHKAPVHEPRRLMPGKLPSGAAIRLFEPGDDWGAAEGIETACSASSIFGVPVWSYINAQNLAKLTPPSGVKRIWLFGDNDETDDGIGSYDGQATVYGLARDLRRRFKLPVFVRIPPKSGDDWNDVARAYLAASVARDG